MDGLPFLPGNSFTDPTVSLTTGTWHVWIGKLGGTGNYFFNKLEKQMILVYTIDNAKYVFKVSFSDACRV